METELDERYRWNVFAWYVSNTKIDGPKNKWTFTCPFCGPLETKSYMKKQRKAALLWNGSANSWVFYCAKQGSPQCRYGGMAFCTFISALNPSLGQAYKKERWPSPKVGRVHTNVAAQDVWPPPSRVLRGSGVGVSTDADGPSEAGCSTTVGITSTVVLPTARAPIAAVGISTEPHGSIRSRSRPDPSTRR
jgi:hypothetical protein